MDGGRIARESSEAPKEGNDTDATLPLLSALLSATDQQIHGEGFVPSFCDEPLNVPTYCLFLLFGMGVSWAMPDALWVQVPYFERFQPEGINLALHFTVCVSITAVLFTPLYVWFEDKLNYRWLIYTMLILEILCCIITMLWWDVTLAAMSIILYPTVFCSTMVGNVFYILLVPYFTKINNYTCAPFLSGQTLASAAVSGLALVQRPGDSNAMFDPQTFYIIMLVAILVPSMIAYILLDRGYLKVHRVRAVEGLDDTVWFFGVPTWWKLIWQYIALYSYLVTIVWVFDGSLIPYAVISTSMTGGDNTGTEQYVYCLMYVGMVLGSLFTTFWRVSNDTTISILTLTFTVLECVFLWISADDSGLWKWEGANVLLVVILFVLGFLYGILLPTLIVNIDERYPSLSLIMNQYMSIAGLVTMFVFVWVAYFGIEGMD